MNRVTSVLHSTAFRLAVYFSILFALMALAVGWSIYAWVSKEFEQRQSAYIADAKGTLLAIAERDGFDDLKNVIVPKSKVSPEAGIVYLLTDESGSFVAGNIDPLPRFEGTRVLPWKTISLRHPWTGSSKPTGISASWTRVQGGYLLIGDDDADIIEAQRVLLRAILTGSIAVVILASLVGGVLGLRAQRRINAISLALDAAGRGHPQLRVQRGRSNDDIDRISAHVNSTLDQLQRVLESLRQVSADIAHDLKKPLGRVQRRLEEVLELDPGVDTYRESVTGALEDIEGLVATFEALLSIAQLEAGLKKQRFRPVDARDLVSSIADDYRLIAQEYGHDLSFDDVSTQPVINGDAELLTQLCTNLIENSIRHCPPNSRIEISLADEGGRVRMGFADNGPGIPEDEREKVFRRLYRLEKSRTTPGHGLGLSLVAAIASLHEGTIELSDNAPGLTVAVTFPEIVPH